MAISAKTGKRGNRSRWVAVAFSLLAASSCGDLLGLEGPVTERPPGGSAGKSGNGARGGASGVGGAGGALGGGNESGSAGTTGGDASITADDAGDSGTAEADVADASGEAADREDAAGPACKDDVRVPLHCPASLACTRVTCSEFIWGDRDDPKRPIGRIPYEFARTGGSEPTVAETLRMDLTDAMAAWAAASSLVRFERCTNDDCSAAGEKRWLHVLGGTDTSLSALSDSGPQRLQLDPAVSKHRLAHELGHVLGLPDVWQRPDRDRYVKLSSSFFCGSVERQHEARKCRVWPGDFVRFPPRPTGLLGPFDSASKMNLYPEQVCTTDGIRPDESFLPTPLDGSAVSELYQILNGFSPFQPLGNPPTVDQIAPGVRIAGSPSLSSVGWPNLTVWVLDSNGHVYSRSRIHGPGADPPFLGWGVWTEHPGALFTSDPAAIAWPGITPQHEAVFARASNGEILWKYSLDSEWSSLGAPPAGVGSAPSVAAHPDRDRLSLFVRGKDDNRLWERIYDSGWAPNWTRLGDREFSGKPAASWRLDREMAVVVAGLDGAVWILRYATVWANEFVSLGGQVYPGSSPALASTLDPFGGPEFTIFIRRAGDSRLYLQNVMKKPGVWHDMGGVLEGDPGAFATNYRRMDVVAPIRADGNVGLWWRFWEYSAPACSVGECDACSGLESETTGVGPCDPSKPFAPPTRLPINDAYLHTSTASLTADQLTLFLTVGTDLRTATRSHVDDEFASSVPFAFNGPGADIRPSVTGDGLTLFFGAGSRGELNVSRIYQATRPNRSGAFAMPTPVAGIGATDPNVNDTEPSPSIDGKSLYFVSNRNGNYDLFVAKRKPNSSEFDAPQAIVQLNTSDLEGAPVISADELTIFWGSNANHSGAKGGLDIYMARRPSLDASFGEAVNVSELNSFIDDYPTYLSPDGCALYIGRSIPDSDILVARRPK